MAGNNRNTVWNMVTTRGIARRLSGALAVLAVAPGRSSPWHRARRG